MSVESRLAQRQPKTETERMLEAEKAKEGLKTQADIASDFIPGVSETKDIISLGKNVGKGDYLAAGMDATALALGAVPIVGDIARRGFKTLFAQDVKNATELLKDDKLIDKWKKDNPNPKPQKRNPDVQKAANELLDGKITGKQYRSVVKENMPIKKINEVPEIPTFTKIVGSLTSDKSKKGILGLNKKIKDGTRVASRLDIPAYEKHDTWIVSVHDAKNKKGIEGLDGDIIGYGKTAVLKNVEFKSSPASAAKISAKRADKGTIARIFGDYVNAEPEEVAASAQKFLNDPEWTQIGYNPFRHGFFYNKDTSMPIKSAEEVLQVGPLVLAKNAKKFTVSEAKKVGPRGGLKIRTPGKTQVAFNEGGANMQKNLEAQQLEMFGDIGMAKSPAKKDPVSGNEIPKASTAEEVRDDIPARLSEGEFVLPADVVRYHGLEKLMNLRQQAKQGINTMDKMGQLGNSEEATMPDDLPFDVNDIEMSEGGFMNVAGQSMPSPRIAGEQIEMQTGGLAGTGTYQVPTNIASTPSYFQNYAQTTAPFRPFVPQNQTAIPPVAPVTPPKTTGPSFQTLIPSQGQRPVTKEYRNAAGQKLFIPFINDKPIYPIPEGYTEYVEEKAEVKKPVVESATVRKPVDEGGDSDILSGTSQVRGTDNSLIDTRFGGQSTEKIKDSFGKMSESQRGLAVINAMESARGSSTFMRNLASGMMGVAGGPLGMVAGAYDAGSRMMDGQGLNLGASQPDALNNIVNSYGYFEDDTDPEGTKESYLNSLSQAVYGRNYEDATTYLGTAPTFRKGFKPGEIDPKTGATYNIYGQSENDDGSVSYSSFSAAGRGFSAMASSGFMGGVADAQRVSTSLTASPKDKARAQAYLDVIGKEEKTSGLIADKKAREEEEERQKAVAEKARQKAIDEANRKARQAIQQAEEKAKQEAKRRQEQIIADQRRRQETVNRGGGDNNGGGGYDPGSDDFSSPDDFGGISDDFGGGDNRGAFVGTQYKTNKGLAGKKKPKVKKMKRGGLASR